MAPTTPTLTTSRSKPPWLALLPLLGIVLGPSALLAQPTALQEGLPGAEPMVEPRPGGAAGQVSLSREVGLMGTRLSMTIWAAERSVALEASEVALRALESTERRLSTWGDPAAERELLRLNHAPAGEAVTLSAELALELAQAGDCVAQTAGAFDPAIGALLAAWDVRGGGRVPAEVEIRAALAASGFDQLHLEPASGDLRSARRTQGALVIEEGGFGKGAGLDRARDAVWERFGDLLRAGALSVRLNLGGQLMRIGGEGDWTVPVADPQKRDQPVLSLAVHGGSVATSGNSEHGFDVRGVRYSHILDPRTGWPAHDFGSLTVVAEQGLAADCLATGLYVLGPEAALDFAARTEGVEVLVLTRGEGRLEAWASAGLEGRMTALQAEMKILVRSNEESGWQVASTPREERPATP